MTFSTHSSVTSESCPAATNIKQQMYYLSHCPFSFKMRLFFCTQKTPYSRCSGAPLYSSIVWISPWPVQRVGLYFHLWGGQFWWPLPSFQLKENCGLHYISLLPTDPDSPFIQEIQMGPTSYSFDGIKVHSVCVSIYYSCILLWVQLAKPLGLYSPTKPALSPPSG